MHSSVQYDDGMELSSVQQWRDSKLTPNCMLTQFDKA